MKFSLKSDDLLSHLVLGNRKVAELVSVTDAWINEGVLEANLTVNGVKVPVEELDNLLNKFWDQAQIESGKEAFHKAVESEVLRLFNEQKDSALESLARLQCKVDAVESNIKFPWEGKL